jgi:hypothetical protein
MLDPVGNTNTNDAIERLKGRDFLGNFSEKLLSAVGLNSHLLGPAFGPVAGPAA